jgi:RHS repeat-associated protein
VSVVAVQPVSQVLLAAVLLVAGLLAPWPAPTSAAATLPRLEVGSLRDAHSQTFLNEDGSYTTSVYEAPVNYRDGRGGWRPIDSSLGQAKKDGYAWENRANSWKVSFKDRSDPGLLWFEAGAVSFSLGLDGASPAGGVREGANGVSYRNVLQQTDLRYSVLGQGVKEALVLRGKNAPASFRFVLTPDPSSADLRAAAGDDGSVAFYRAGMSEPAFWLGAPIVSDSAAAASTTDALPSAGAPAGSTPASGGKAPEVAGPNDGLASPAAGMATMGVSRLADGSFEVTVSVDQAWLSDPDRVFPVVVDPTISGQADLQDGYWDTSVPAAGPNSSDAELLSGTSGASSFAAGLIFGLGSVPAGAKVTSARVSLYMTRCIPTDTSQYASYGCPYWWFSSGNYTSTIDLYQINTGWNSSTPFSTVNASLGSTSLGSYSAQFYQSTGQRVPTGLTLGNASLVSTVQAIVNGSQANNGFLIKKTAGDATGMALAGSRYTDVSVAPRLEIEWSGDGVQLAEPQHLHSNGAELSWQSYTGGLGPYAAAVLADTPTAFWRLDDPVTSGFGIADWTGTGQNMTGAPASYLEPGGTADGDQSIYFDGGQHVEVPEGFGPQSNITDTFTIEAWVKRGTLGSAQTIFSRGESNGGGFRLFFGADNRLKLSLGDCDGCSDFNTFDQSSNAIADTNWHQVAATKSGSAVHVYVDGADVTQYVNPTPTLTNGLGTVVLGSSIGNCYPSCGRTYRDYFSGWIDEAAVYDHVLGAAQIGAHYTAGAQAIAAFDRFELHRSTSQSFTPSSSTLVQTVRDSAQTSWRDTTAKPSTTFYYRVVTYTNAGANAYVSNEVTASMPPPGTATIIVQPGVGRGVARATSVSSANVCANQGAAATLTLDPSTRSLLQFDLRSIPAGATATSASLQLFTFATASATVSAARASADWTEGTETGTCNGSGASWQSRQPNVGWASAGGDYDGSSAVTVAVPGGVPHWDSWNLQSIVQGWLNGSNANLGVLLKHQTETGAPTISYASNEYATSLALRPKLVISYSDNSAALAPQIAIGYPAPSQQVMGTVAVTAGASDDGRVTGVQFKLDGANLGALHTSAPYTVSWDTTTASRGAHTLSAVATDEAGNTATASSVSVTVANSNAPTVAAPALTIHPYSATVTADSPNAYWRLGETSGTTYASSVGTFNGTWTGSPTLGASGALLNDTNTAVSLNGTSQYGTVADANQLDFTNNFSVELWLKRSTNAALQAVVGKPLTVTTKSENYALWVDTANKLRFEIGDGRASKTALGATALDTNWHHIVGTFASGTLALYVDGALSATVSGGLPNMAAANTSQLQTGRAGTSNYFGGSLDEVAVYPTVLSPTQVASHYNAGLKQYWDAAVSAGDDYAVTKVDFLVDGNRFVSDASSPYAATLETLSPALPTYDGSHQVTAKVYDADGNATVSAATALMVANTAGTKYKGTITTNAVLANTTGTIPAEMRYDPTAGSQDAVPLTVNIANGSGMTWPTASVKLRYRWLNADGSELSSSGDLSIGATDLATGANRNVAVTVQPPTLTTAVMRGRLTLRIDLYDTTAAAYFAGKGNQPLEQTLTVTRVQPDELGLERYQQYDGDNLGGGADDSVNLANGNHVVQWQPLTEPGRGLNTTVSLTYNSLEAGSVSQLGNNWSLALSSLTPLGLPLDIHPNAADTAAGRTGKWVGFTDADGSYHRFSGNTAGTYYTAPAGVHLYLKYDGVATADKRWQIVKPDRTTYLFDAQGYPTRVQDGDGNALTIGLQDPVPAGEDAYGLGKRVTTVTDAGGRAFTIAYYSKAETATPPLRGKLKSISDHAGHRLRFDYYDDGNLMRLSEEGGTNADDSYLAERALLATYTNPAGTGPAIATLTARKTPDAATIQSTKLFSLIDFRGNETSFAYSSSGATAGRLTSRTNRSGDQTVYAYDTVAQTATVSMPLARTWAYTFDSQGRVTGIDDPVNPANTTVLWTADNTVSRVTEPTGQYSQYAHNANGYLTSKTDELGQQTTLTYQSFAIDANDASGNWEPGRSVGHISRVSTVTKPVGNATAGNPTDYKWTFAYVDTLEDHVLSVTDPLGNATSNSWNADGTLASTTLPANGDSITRTTTYNSYDPNGLATQATDPAGGISRASYLANGNLAWQQDPNHASHSGGTPAHYQQQYSYDSYGRFGRSSQPKSTGLLPGLLIWDDTAYDANDNTISQINAHYGQGDSGSAPQTTSVYDAMDRPTSVTGPRATADGGATTSVTTYDAAGRPVTATAPNGVKTTPSGSAWAKDFETDTDYDALDRVATTTSFAVTAAGAEDPAQRRVTHFCYDLAGDLRTVTGPKGASAFSACPAITTGTYSPYAGAYTNRYDYDAAHRQTKATDPLGNSQQTGYNENGQPVTSTDANNKQTTYAYDDRGSKVSQAEPFDSGRTLTSKWEYDALGNVKRLIPPRAYDIGGAAGPWTSLVESRSYDALGRLVKTVLPSEALGFYRLGEPSGTTMTDSVGTRNGTYTGGVSLQQAGAVASDPNLAALFDGSSGYGLVSSPAPLDSGNYSLEAWFKTTSMAAGTKGIVRDGSLAGVATGLMVNAGQQLAFNASDGATIVTANSAGTVNDGLWHHAVGTRNGSTFTLYLDGAQVGQATGAPADVDGSSATLRIGARVNGAGAPIEFFAGTIDEVALYPTGLSAAAVQSHYTAPAGSVQAYAHIAYDANGQRTVVSLPSNRSDPASLQTAEKTTVSYWDPGWVLASTDPATPRARFDYTPEGWQAARTPDLAASPGTLDLGRTMYWDYLPDGLLQALRDLGGQRASYAYDANGNKTVSNEANGLTQSGQAALNITSGFDGFDELQSVATPKFGVGGCTQTTSFGYDLHGNTVSVGENAEAGAGCATVAARLFSYAHDGADRLTAQTDDFRTAAAADDHQYLLTYTADSRLSTKTIRSNSSAWVQEQRSVRTYFDNGLLKTLQNYDGTATAVEDHTLSYMTAAGVYMNGNRVQDVFTLKQPADAVSPTCVSAACTASWAYDGRGRLTGEVTGTGTTTAFTLDAAGNAVQEIAGATTTTRVFSGQRLAAVTVGGITNRFVYDAAGNTDCVVAGSWLAAACPAEGNWSLLTDYVHDYANRLVATRFYNGGGTRTDSAEYTVDPLGRPQKQVETHTVTDTVKGTEAGVTATTFTYLGASDGVSSETAVLPVSGTKVRAYAFDGLGQRATVSETVSGATTHYSYSYDPHGSVSVVLDQAGLVKASYGYTAYGSANTALTKTASGFSAATNPYRYTGKRFDSGSNTLDMGARRYSPTTGRFLQQDLYYNALDDFGLSSDPLTANRYLFTGANPINYIETDGHMPIDVAEPGNGPISNEATQQFIQEQLSQPCQGQRCKSAIERIEFGFDAAGLLLTGGTATGIKAGIKTGIKTTIAASKRLAARQAAKKAAKAVDEGIYVIKGSRGTYVGESGNIPGRLAQHVESKRFTQAEVDSAERIGVVGGKTAREIAEQQKIDELGGIDALLNLRNPIGRRRLGLMPRPYSRP